MSSKTKAIVATYLAWQPLFQFAPPMFWVVAIAGFALISLPYFVFEPSPANVMPLCIFAAYNGLVLYVIYAMSFMRPAILSIARSPWSRPPSRSCSATLGRGRGPWGGLARLLRRWLNPDVLRGS